MTNKQPTREQIREIIKDWVMTIPLDDNPSDEDYDEVTQSIWEAIYGKPDQG